MTFGRFFLLLTIVAFSVAGGFFLGQQNRVSVTAQKKPAAPAQILNLLKQFAKEKIRHIEILEFENEKFFAVVSETAEPSEKDSTIRTSDRLSIYDESGKIVYEYRDVSIGGLATERLLKPDSRELIFSANGGGTDWFFNILSYQNGKFTEIVESKDTQYRGGYFTVPQYRTGSKTPYFKPSQLILIQQLGGADENPRASVFRTKDGKLQKAGEIRMREFGDFIEAQLAKNRSAR